MWNQVISGVKWFKIPETESTLLSVKYILLWYGHRNFYRNSLETFFFFWPQCQSLGLEHSVPRIQANYHLGVRQWVSLDTQCLQWELSLQQIVYLKKISKIKLAALSLTVSFYQHHFLLILLIDTKFSLLCFHEFIGKCLEEIERPDLTHVLLLFSILEKVASFPQSNSFFSGFFYGGGAKNIVWFRYLCLI